MALSTHHGNFNGATTVAAPLLDASWKSLFDDLVEGVLVLDGAGHRAYSNGALNALVGTDACFPLGTVEPPPYVPADQRQRYLQAVQGSASLISLEGSGTTSTWIDLAGTGHPKMRTRVTIAAFSNSRGRFAVWLLKPEGHSPPSPAGFAQSAPASSCLDGLTVLTRREKDVLQLLLEGQRVSSIARRLHLSPQTVRNHLKAIFRKLGAHSQVELIEALRPAFGRVEG
jgi:DNA-binding CsgD family transcriptional regulator